MTIRVRGFLSLRAQFVAVLGLSGLALACQPLQQPGQDSGAVSAGAGSGDEDATTAALVDPGQQAAPMDAEKAALMAKLNTPEQAPAEQGRSPDSPAQQTFVTRADAYFASHPEQRAYIQLDKPLYQPGETIWVRAMTVDSAALSYVKEQIGVHLELISPKGAVVIDQYVKQQGGVASSYFDLPQEVQGGEYAVRLRSDTGLIFTRPVIVNVYEPPRFKKKLDFVRKAYGPGDTVSATVEVKRPTGEAFAERELSGQITLDGQALPRVKVKTNAQGAALLRLNLPDKIERGDGILTVFVDDRGITESVSKRVPIVLKKIQLSFFPEGGDLVQGLPSRVYFFAQNMINKPADIEGKIVDDHGQTMATFSSFHDGMGRFALTPATGRSYHAEISKPVGVGEHFALPIASESGCVLRSFDDPAGTKTSTDISLRCSEDRDVVVAMSLRNKRIATASAKARVGFDTVLHLQPSEKHAQGVARVTVFTPALEPLAERLVYRGWHQDLRVKLTPDRASYAPRDAVALKVETTDLDGKPVSANLALAVVDDTVLSYADDKTAQLHARLFLESELPGKIEEPNFYFDRKKPKAAKALDMLLGSRGWRRFEWQQVLSPPPPPKAVTGMPGVRGMGQLAQGLDDKRPGKMRNKAAERHAGREAKFGRAQAKGAKPQAAPMPKAAPPMQQAPMEAEPMPAADKALAAKMPMAGEKMIPEQLAPAPVVAAGKIMAEPNAEKAAPLRRRLERGFADAERPQDGVLDVMDGPAGGGMAKDDDWDRAKAKKRMAKPAPVWAKVRVFPLPDYQPDYAGPRTDFRETIYWNPELKTDAEGQAHVTFYMSDAVTSFRVICEGLGGGLPAHHEQVLSSKLPFHMEVKLPMEVSSGDLINLPLTLSNDINMAVRVQLTSRFGDAVKLLENSAPEALDLNAESGETLTFPLAVVGQMGETEVHFAAHAKGLNDAFTRRIKVVPKGFPRSFEASGTLQGRAELPVDLTQALAGSISAELRLYPSPLADMVSGVESMLQEPSGCFEQTSSSNYPNIMVMRYLQEHDAAEPEIAERANALLKRGYNKLTGFESPDHGYEWFGGNPGHEALTAYGLMEFVDMQGVMPGVDKAMIGRTREWLRKRRDGQGGFLRNDRALDSFGRASKAITDAYIVYALSEAGLGGMDKELQAVTSLAQQSADPYLVALVCNAALNAKTSAARSLLKKLVGSQQKDGRFKGADQSITCSGGQSLDIETTSLAILAMVKSGSQQGPTRKAVQWLLSTRSGGSFGATQSTILALKALSAYAAASKQMPAGGEVSVLVNGQKVGRQSFAKGRNEPIIFAGLGAHFKLGKNSVKLQLSSGVSLPYSLSLGYRTTLPASSETLPLDLKLTTAKTALKMGETLRVEATLQSRSAQGLPMTLLRLGIPGGLALQTWQLKELVDKKIIDFYETRPRELIVYFRALAPKAQKTIAVDLVARVPGTYSAPASSSYLYYTPEEKTWAPEYQIEIAR